MNYQNKRSGGGGQRGGFSRGGGFSQRNESFQATCAECGNDCTVPFKPNGRKPVLCSNCFQGGDRDNSRRPSYSDRSDRSDRKPFNRSSERPRFDRPANDSGVQEELKQIRRKLERILQILEEVSVEEVQD